MYFCTQIFWEQFHFKILFFIVIKNSHCSRYLLLEVWLVEMINIYVNSDSKLLETQKLLLMNHILININQMDIDIRIPIDRSWKKISMSLSDFERIKTQFYALTKVINNSANFDYFRSFKSSQALIVLYAFTDQI